MFGLAALPYEVTANIVGRINFDDVFNLAATCRALSFLLKEERICKSIVQVILFNPRSLHSIAKITHRIFQLLTLLI